MVEIRGHLLPITLPQLVRIHNTRLQLLYTIAWCIGLTILGIYFFLARRWESELLFSNNLISSLEPVTQHNPYAKALNESEVESTCSQRPSPLAYQWDKAGHFTYDNFTCPEICELGLSGPDCFMISQLLSREEQGTFFTTYMRISPTVQDNVSHAAGTETQQKIPTVKQHIFPLDDRYELTVSYRFQVMDQYLKTFTNLWRPGTFEGNDADTPTVILDHRGNLEKVVEPGVKMQMSLHSLFTLAGIPELLDTPKPAIGKNWHPNATFHSGPLARIAGTQLSVSLKCTNFIDMPLFQALPGVNDKMCALQVRHEPALWVGQTFIEHMYSVPRIVQRYGVLIKVVAEVKVRVMDLSAIGGFFIHSVVLLGLLPKIFRFFLEHCMGLLSKIFLSILRKEVTLEEHMASLAMRMVATSKMFDNLCGSESRLSLQAMRSKFAGALKNTELNSYEVDSFATFCFIMALIHEASARKSEHVGSLKELLRSFSTDLDLKLQMTRAGFLASTHCSEQISVGNAVQFFDNDRKVGWIEHFFLPLAFRRLLPTSVNSICDEDDSPESEEEKHDGMTSTDTVSSYASVADEVLKNFKVHVEELLAQQKAEILAYMHTKIAESHAPPDNSHVSITVLDQKTPEALGKNKHQETADDVVGKASHDDDTRIQKLNLRIMELAAKFADIENFCQKLHIVQEGKDDEQNVKISTVLAFYDHKIQSTSLGVKQLQESFNNVLHNLRTMASGATETDFLAPNVLCSEVGSSQTSTAARVPAIMTTFNEDPVTHYTPGWLG